MTESSTKYYLNNYLFLGSLFLLICNDHFWKYQYGNWWTGKLSDFAGLLILPLFLAFLFPKKVKFATLASGLFFIFWKSPFSESVIQFYNQFAWIPICRVIDYSDLMALAVLPLAHWIILNIKDLNCLKIHKLIIPSYVLFIITSFAFMATSLPYNYWFQLYDAEVRVKEKYLVELKESEILAILKNEGFMVEKDTFVFEFYSGNHLEQKSRQHNPYYLIEPMVIEKDTFPKIQFAIDSIFERESWIYLNGLELPNNLNKKHAKRKLRKYYEQLFQQYFIDN